MKSTNLWIKEEIVKELDSQHAAFNVTIAELEEKQFTFLWEGKWTPGQQLEHIRKSVAPIVLAFRLPRFLLKYQFGLTNRPSRTYNALVQKYLTALDGHAAIAPVKFQPKEVPFSQKQKKLKAYESTIRKLKKVALKTTEEELDLYVLPHPLIGKLTLREMLFFCIYHVQHHHKITKDIIGNFPKN